MYDVPYMHPLPRVACVMCRATVWAHTTAMFSSKGNTFGWLSRTQFDLMLGLYSILCWWVTVFSFDPGPNYWVVLGDTGPNHRKTVFTRGQTKSDVLYFSLFHACTHTASKDGITSLSLIFLSPITSPLSFLFLLSSSHFVSAVSTIWATLPFYSTVTQIHIATPPTLPPGCHSNSVGYSAPPPKTSPPLLRLSLKPHPHPLPVSFPITSCPPIPSNTNSPTPGGCVPLIANRNHWIVYHSREYKAAQQQWKGKKRNRSKNGDLDFWTPHRHILSFL